tara:strand:- start:81 stop:1796 length:1716 start_codon:yes stop_codon:yes gene_type:complete
MISDILKFLVNREKIKMYLLTLFIFFATILEVLGYALIIPVLTIIIKSKSSILEFSLIKNNTFLSEYFLTTSEQTLIVHTILLMVIFFSVKTVYLVNLMYFRESFFFNIKARLSRAFFQKYILKNYVNFIKKNSSFYITNILNEVTCLVERRIRSLIYILNECLIIIFFFVTLVLVNFKFTLTIFSIFSLILFTFLFFTKKVNVKYANLRQFHDFKQIKDLNESFTLFKYLKIHHLEKLFFDRFSKSNQKVNDAGKFEIILNEIPKNIFELASILTIFCAVLIFFSNNDNNIVNIIPYLGFLVLSIGRMIPSLTRISNSIQSFRFAEPCIKVLNEEFNFEEKKFFDFKNKKLNDLSKINLQNISFEYENKNILKNVSLNLEKKIIYGISGETGSGKTTLIDIITGLHQNYTGSILLNGKKLEKPLYQMINIGYVPQNIFLVDDTIKNNILINNINNIKISQEKMNQIINITCLKDFISKLDSGLETLIGENGVSISGGQKQRIGLARSIIGRPDLLILDEAMNALNYEVSNKIIKNLKDLEMTIIIVSHDKELINHCDKIINLKNGVIEIL